MAFIADNCPKSAVLRTRSHCEECQYGVMSMLRKVQGVYSIAIDADRNTITITGSSAPKELLNTLLKVYQDADFCIKPPAHVPPSGCPGNKVSNNLGLPTCPNPQGGCYGPAAPPRCCACTGQGRFGHCYYSNYHGHGRC